MALNITDPKDNKRYTVSYDSFGNETSRVELTGSGLHINTDAADAASAQFGAASGAPTDGSRTGAQKLGSTPINEPLRTSANGVGGVSESDTRSIQEKREDISGFRSSNFINTGGDVADERFSKISEGLNIGAYNPPSGEGVTALDIANYKVEYQQAALAASAAQTQSVVKGAGAEVEALKGAGVESTAVAKGEALEKADPENKRGIETTFPSQPEPSTEEKITQFNTNKQIAAAQKEAMLHERTQAGKYRREAEKFAEGSQERAYYNRLAIDSAREMDQKNKNKVNAEEQATIAKQIKALYGDDVPDGVTVDRDPDTGRLVLRNEDIEKDPLLRLKKKLADQRADAMEDYNEDYNQARDIIMANEPDPTNPSAQTNRQLADLERKRNKFVTRMDKKIDDQMEEGLLSEEAREDTILANAAKANTPEALQARDLLKEKVDGVNAILDANPQMTTTEALKQYNDIGKESGSKKLTKATMEVMGWVNTGSVPPADMVDRILKMDGVKTMKDVNTVLGGSMPSSLQKSLMEDYWTDRGFPGSALTASDQKTQNRIDFLEGDLGNTAGVAFIAGQTKDERELLLTTARDSGVYAPDSDMGKFIEAQVGAAGGALDEQINSMLLMPSIYGIPTRLVDSELDREKFETFVREQTKNGLDIYQIKDLFTGFIINEESAKPFGETMRSHMALAKDLGDQDLSNLARNVNAGNDIGAMELMERRVMSGVDDGFKDSKLARETLVKAQSALSLLEKSDLKMLGKWDGRKFRIQSMTPESGWSDEKKQQFVDTQRLSTKLVAMMSPYRKENIGSQVTEAELSLLEPIMADILDQPSIMGAKIEELRTTVLEQYNATRDTAGLPMVTKEELLSTKERLKLYQNITNERVGRAGNVINPGNIGTASNVPATAADFIIGFEGFRDTAYDDAGVKSIGYGTRANGRTNLSEPEARTEMQAHITDIVEPVIQAQFPGVNSNQKTALSSFLYNLGTAPENSEKLFTAIKENDTNTIIDQWLQFDKAEGKTNPALVKRRRQELALYLTPELTATPTIEEVDTTTEPLPDKTPEEMENDWERIQAGQEVKLKSIPEELFGALGDAPSDIIEGVGKISDRFSRYQEKVDEIDEAQGIDTTTDASVLLNRPRKEGEPEQGAFRSMWQQLGAGAGFAAGVVEDVFGTLLKIPASDNMENIANEITERIMPGIRDTELLYGVTVGDAFQKITGRYEELKIEDPARARDLEAAGGFAALATEVLTLGKAGEFKEGTEEAIKTGLRQSIPAETRKFAGEVIEGVDDVFKKAPVIAESVDSKLIKIVEETFIPSTKSAPKGTTYTAIQKQKQQIADAAKIVVKDKRELNFFDKNGKIAKGRLPKSLDETSQVLERLRISKYDKYTEMAEQVGGTPIDGKDVIKSLREDEVFDKGMKLLRKDPGKNKTIIDRVETELAGIESQTYTSKELQGIIQQRSGDLDSAFAANKGKLNSSQTADLMVLEKLKEAQHNMLLERFGAAGGQWSQLKREYGALRQMEVGLNKRYAALNKNVPGGGLTGLVSTFSVGDLVYGMAAGNWGSIARAGAQGSMALVRRNATDPDKLIKKLFKEAEKTLK